MGITAAIGIGLGAVSAGGQVYGAIKQSEAQRAQGEEQKILSDVNAKLADLQSDDALRRGDVMAGTISRQASQVQGAQRAAYAASGLDTAAGTPGDVLGETETLGAHDAMTARNNAWREAWGYKVDAAQATEQGQFAKRAGDNAANTTLITGGLKAVGSIGNTLATWGTGGLFTGTPKSPWTTVTDWSGRPTMGS